MSATLQGLGRALTMLLLALALAAGWPGAAARGAPPAGGPPATAGVVWAWGHDGEGQLGDGVRGNPERVPIAESVPGLTGVVALAGGDGHSLAVTDDGAVWAWGHDGYGELGDGIAGDNRATPARIASPPRALAIAAGGAHSLALAADRTVWAWGYDGAGQLGDGSPSPGPDGITPTPQPVRNLTGVVALAAGDAFSLALRSDGTVWAWGADGQGQLGDGVTGEGSATPTQIAGLSDIVAIAAGAHHALALAADGTAWAWGYAARGQLGGGTIGGPDCQGACRATPERIVALPRVVALAAGGFHSLALRADGTVWTWGANEYGQLGNGRGEGQTGCVCEATPARIYSADLIHASAITAGAHHSLALGADGTVWAWGEETYGQLGDGMAGGPFADPFPVAVRGLRGVIAVAAGGRHSLALAPLAGGQPGLPPTGAGGGASGRTAPSWWAGPALALALLLWFAVQARAIRRGGLRR